MTAPDDEPDLAPLVGSRICHDLASPIGAVNNGFELLELTGTGGGEMDLVRSSITGALARLDFLRLAFGAGSANMPVACAEVRRIIQACYGEGRFSVEWRDGDDHARGEVRLALLALNCVEAAIPGRAQSVVTRDDGRWRVEAETKAVKDMDGTWDALRRGVVPADLPSEHVQFGLLARHTAAAGRSVSADLEPPKVVVIV